MCIMIRGDLPSVKYSDYWFGHLDSLCHNDGCCRFQFSFFSTWLSFTFGHFLLSFSPSVFEFALNWIYYCPSVSVWESETLGFLKPLSLWRTSLLPSNCSPLIQKWKLLFNLKTASFWWGCVATGLHLTSNMITPQVLAYFILSLITCFLCI